MKLKYIIAIAFLCLSFAANSQMKTGEYYAYKVVKDEKVPDIITIKVIQSMNDGSLKFIDRETKKPLQGTYYITETRVRYNLATFKDGLPDGYWEEYYHDELFKKIAYANGKRHGKYYSYQDGGIFSEVTFENDIQRHYISYHKNGKVRSEEFNDEQGRSHGRFLSYDRHGNITEEKNYVHGSLEGRSFEKRSNYTIEKEYKNNEPVVVRELFLDGVIKSEENFSAGGKKNGRSFSVYDNGKLRKEDWYEQGKIKKSKAYFRNGTLSSERDFDENGNETCIVYYNESPHSLSEEANYSGRKLHGIRKNYDQTGSLQEETLYRYGEAIREKAYTNGKLVSVSIIDETGNLVKVEQYNTQGKRTYKNATFKKHPSVVLKEDASGIIDIVIETK